MSSPRGAEFSVQVAPLKQQADRVAHVTITDRGTAQLHVYSFAEQVKGCGTRHLVRDVGIRPGTFSVTPGHSVITSVDVAHVPSGDYLAVYMASASGSGNVHIAGGVGSQVLVRSGSACLASPVHHGTPGFPVVLLVVFGLVALLLVSLGLVRKVRRTPWDLYARACISGLSGWSPPDRGNSGCRRRSSLRNGGQPKRRSAGQGEGRSILTSPNPAPVRPRWCCRSRNGPTWLSTSPKARRHPAGARPDNKHRAPGPHLIHPGTGGSVMF
jgi:hypothetical protein